MYKTLFVDDERLIREGISNLIDWERITGQELTLAENAKVDRDIHEYKSLLTVSDIDVKSQKVEVEVGNIFDKSKA